MRIAILPVVLVSFILPAAAPAETMWPGQSFNQQQQQYQQYLQQQQMQQQQQQYQQYQQPQQYPAQPPYQPPAGMPGQPQQYQQPPSYPQYQPPPQVLPVPSGSQPGGPCTVNLGADRSTIHLMDPDGTERKHVPLGQDRVQKVFNSPDGAWSVAIYKIRGEQQYGFIALDLAKCEEQPPVELPSNASSAAFDGGEVVLALGKGEQKFKMKNQAIR